jgi:hypothetical protein
MLKELDRFFALLKGLAMIIVLDIVDVNVNFPLINYQIPYSNKLDCLDIIGEDSRASRQYIKKMIKKPTNCNFIFL